MLVDMASTTLSNLNPLDQLRAGRLPLRLSQLFVGLTVYGISLAMMFRSGYGMPPWGVLDTGVAKHLGLEVGVAVILVGSLLLLLWIPLRQWPGLGTVANTIWIGLATDVGLSVLPAPHAVPSRLALMVGGVVLNAVASALYIGAQFGAGPRDGMMTGLHHRFGWSLRVVRLSIEIVVLLVGWLLGGSIGIGTALYALAIGPLIQAVLPPAVVPLNSPRPEPSTQSQPAAE